VDVNRLWRSIVELGTAGVARLVAPTDVSSLALGCEGGIT
jgi:hypothetical protein